MDCDTLKGVLSAKTNFTFTKGVCFCHAKQKLNGIMTFNSCSCDQAKPQIRSAIQERQPVVQFDMDGEESDYYDTDID